MLLCLFNISKAEEEGDWLTNEICGYDQQFMLLLTSPAHSLLISYPIKPVTTRAINITLYYVCYY